MIRIALGVSYVGSAWQGWQSQPGGCTVQDALELALARFANQPIRVACAGRTDAGVHALAQVVHFDTTAQRSQSAWVRGLNAHLPPSIAVQWAQPVSDQFHARFSAIARSYQYLLFVSPTRSPHYVGRTGWIYRPVNLTLMRSAAQILIGTHDFSAFRSAACQAKSPIKTLHCLELEQHGPFIVFNFRANAFLHHMVRNLVGSLIAVGQAKQSPECLAKILAQRDRARAAPTFMPDGLYFAAVEYDAGFQIPSAPSLTALFPGLVC